MKATKTFDKERISLNLAKLKKGGEMFEVILEPDKVIEYKKGQVTDVRDVIRYEKIFSDAKKGLQASEEHMKTLFDTEDVLKVIKIILDEGEIQFTQEYRDQLREDKRKRIIDIIVRNAVDPTTHLPHPRTRIENAFAEAKIKIDEMADAENQVQDILAKLRPIMPIKFALKEIFIRIPPAFAGKGFPIVQKYGKILNSNWQSDGSWICTVEIPAGLQNDFFDILNGLTHGNIESRIVNEK